MSITHYLAKRLKFQEFFIYFFFEIMSEKLTYVARRRKYLKEKEEYAEKVSQSRDSLASKSENAKVLTDSQQSTHGKIGDVRDLHDRKSTDTEKQSLEINNNKSSVTSVEKEKIDNVKPSADIRRENIGSRTTKTGDNSRKVELDTMDEFTIYKQRLRDIIEDTNDSDSNRTDQLVEDTAFYNYVNNRIKDFVYEGGDTILHLSARVDFGGTFIFKKYEQILETKNDDGKTCLDLADKNGKFYGRYFETCK